MSQMGILVNAVPRRASKSDVVLLAEGILHEFSKTKGPLDSYGMLPRSCNLLLSINQALAIMRVDILKISSKGSLICFLSFHRSLSMGQFMVVATICSS